MTPQQFIAKWKQADLSERSAAQQHFLARSRHSLRFRPQLQDVPDGSRATMRARALVELTAVAMATALVHQVAPLGTLNVMEHGHVDNQNGPEPERAGAAAFKVFLNFGGPIRPEREARFIELRDKFKQKGR